MSAEVSKFPENFVSLHAGEEFLRTQAIAAIEASNDLRTHCALIESGMNLINYFSRDYVGVTDSERILQHLGARLFNASASGLKLLLAGYYQASALQQRDMLETIFLLDYFSTDAALITQWQTSPPKERWSKFRPSIVRQALDKRDGFNMGRRKAAYDLLTELAGHPTPQGVIMLKPQGLDAHIGPFFDETALLAVLSELAKHVGQAGANFMNFFPLKEITDYRVNLAFRKANGHWFENILRAPL
jgi:hypothetical protein